VLALHVDEIPKVEEYTCDRWRFSSAVVITVALRVGQRMLVQCNTASDVVCLGPTARGLRKARELYREDARLIEYFYKTLARAGRGVAITARNSWSRERTNRLSNADSIKTGAKINSSLQPAMVSCDFGDMRRPGAGLIDRHPARSRIR
jgi:hypothetical protein